MPICRTVPSLLALEASADASHKEARYHCIEYDGWQRLQQSVYTSYYHIAFLPLTTSSASTISVTILVRCTYYNISKYTYPDGTLDGILVPSEKACPIEEVKECVCICVQHDKVQDIAESNNGETTIRRSEESIHHTLG